MSFYTYTPTDGETKTQRLSDGCMYTFQWSEAEQNWIQIGEKFDCIDPNTGNFGGSTVTITNKNSSTFNPPKFICSGSPNSTFDGWIVSSTGAVVEEFAAGVEVCLPAVPPVVKWVVNNNVVYNTSTSRYEAYIGYTNYTAIQDPVLPPPPPTSGSGYIQTDFNTAAGINLDTMVSITRTSGYSLSTPLRGTLTINSSLVTYTPTTGLYGADSFTFTYQGVRDSINYTLTGIVYVNVLAPILQPTGPSVSLTISPSTISAGKSTSISWAAQNASLAFILPAIGNVGTTGSTVISPGGTTTYTITAQTSTGAQITSSATVTVIPTAVAPVAVNIGVNCAYQNPIYIPLEYSGEATLAQIVSQPSNGTVSVNGYTALYTPATGYTGSDSFTYKIHGPGGDSNIATVTITVQTPSCPQPTVSLTDPTTQMVLYNTAKTINFTLTQTTDTITPIVLPNFGVLSANVVSGGSASIVYTPYSSFLGGSDSFSIVAVNSCGQSSLLTVPIHVSTPPAPQAANSIVNVNHNTPATFFFTYTGYATTVESISSPSSGTLTATSVPFQYSYSPFVDYSGNAYVNFKVHGPGGLSSNQGTVTFVVAPPTVVYRPDPIEFINFFNQPSAIQLICSSATFGGGFSPNYSVALSCVADSYTTGATTQQLTSLYAVGFRRTRGSTVSILGNTGVPVQDTDVFEPIVLTATAVSGVARTLTFRVRVSGNAMDPSFVRDTFFTVSTAPADQQPDVFDFINQQNLERNATVTTNAVLIKGMTAGVPVPAKVVGPRPAVLIVNDGTGDVVTGASTTIFNNMSIKVQTTAPSSFSTTETYTVTVGDPSTPISDTFSLTTRNIYVTDPPWNFGNRNNLELNTAYYTPNTVTFVDLEGSVNFSVNNNANVVLNGVDTLTSNAVINNGSAVSILAKSATTYGTNKTFTVTMSAGNVSKNDTFTFTTRLKDTVPQLGQFANLTYQQLNVSVQSSNITVTNFDETANITLISTDTSAILLINNVASGTSNTVVSGDIVAIQATTANGYFTTTQYNVICNNVQTTWTTLTKSNDDQQLLAPF